MYILQCLSVPLILKMPRSHWVEVGPSLHLVNQYGDLVDLVESNVL